MKMIFFLLLFSACGDPDHSRSSPKNNLATGKDPINKTVMDTIKVKVDEAFEIKLATSMGTGYRWEVEDPGYLKYMSLDSISVVNNVDGKDNGSDLQVFHFRALARSETLLHFVHRRSWEKNRPPDKEKTFLVIID